MNNWRIGCSGFYYKHWKEHYYPHGLAQSKWFDFYCKHFYTLELNVTFYRFPQLSFLENWYAKSPEAFIFSVKAPRMITHCKKFSDTGALIAEYYHTVEEGLKHKLGCILFQLPPSYQYSHERLDKICQSLDPSFSNVVEFRHVSWWNQEVYNRLALHQISFCSMSHPLLPQEAVQNTGILYYRFHGIPELYTSRYAPGELQRFADEVDASGITRQSFIYIDNDIGGSAIDNAREMLAYCSKKNA